MESRFWRLVVELRDPLTKANLSSRAEPPRVELGGFRKTVLARQRNWMTLAEEEGEGASVASFTTKGTWSWAEPMVTKETWSWAKPMVMKVTQSGAEPMATKET